ncbi:sigma-E factor negative regulatory protein [Ramlibacter sp. MMS24-I3-19]|uniref:sigma-E factor negative regulatory protein n=1 Tax=Ramlibacter sp. MMS24-I3-19 TaxID=3416606 RepID=UPI003D091536
MDKMDNNELISALADGQLQGEAFALAVQATCADRSTLATWHAYHVIGDVLRSGEASHAAASQPFLDKLSARLAQESCPQPVVVPAVGVQPGWSSAVAANDASMRWKLLAGVASVAAVAAVGWSIVGTGSGGAPSAQPQLAAAPSQQAAPVLARSEAGVMIRDPRLDELLAAHRQFGGASALQMPAGFVRNATFEGPSR